MPYCHRLAQTHSTDMVDLFGDPLPPTNAESVTLKKRQREIAPHPSSDDILTLAENLPAALHLGTSSWSFAGWVGLVYADKYSESRLSREGLGAYSAHPLLRTVSLDRTFYAPLAEADYTAYARQVPDHFRFVVKAPMAITAKQIRDAHGSFTDSPFFLDSEYATNEFVAPCSIGLGEKVGVLVFQFPPLGRFVCSNPDPFINQLYRFLKGLPTGMRHAVEVRDAALLTTRFFKCLHTTSTQFCVASHANMPSPAEQIRCMKLEMPPNDFICRWSLHAGFKYEDAKSRYLPFNKLVDEDIDNRLAIADAAAAAVRAGHRAFVTINNKAEGSAPLSVAKLAAAIRAKLI